jgi:malate dehydrogenase (oxaloacetate-decarboxylating)(NADP+)
MDDARTTAEAIGDTRTARVTAEEALALHAEGRPGKLEIRLTKPLTTARDLSLAYSPGRGGALPAHPPRPAAGL